MGHNDFDETNKGELFDNLVFDHNKDNRIEDMKDNVNETVSNEGFNAGLYQSMAENKKMIR